MHDGTLEEVLDDTLDRVLVEGSADVDCGHLDDSHDSCDLVADVSRLEGSAEGFAGDAALLQELNELLDLVGGRGR